MIIALAEVARSSRTAVQHLRAHGSAITGPYKSRNLRLTDGLEPGTLKNVNERVDEEDSAAGAVRAHLCRAGIEGVRDRCGGRQSHLVRFALRMCAMAAARVSRSSVGRWKPKALPSSFTSLM